MCVLLAYTIKLCECECLFTEVIWNVVLAKSMSVTRKHVSGLYCIAAAIYRIWIGFICASNRFHSMRLPDFHKTLISSDKSIALFFRVVVVADVSSLCLFSILLSLDWNNAAENVERNRGADAKEKARLICQRMRK